MKKQILMLTVTLFTAAGALAQVGGGGMDRGTGPAKFGVGVGQSTLFGSGSGDSETTIMVPIVAGDLMIEPFIGFNDSETTTGGGTTESESWTLGSGLFVNFHKAKKTAGYFGGRVWFTDAEATGPFGKNETDGWGLAPTVGFAWYPTGDHFSLGGELFVSYTDLDGDFTNPAGNKTSSDSEALNTGTRFFLRYMF